MIDGNATYSQIVAEYGNTAAPFDSEDQCRRFIRAANLLLAQPIESTSREGGTRFDREAIAKQLEDAKVELQAYRSAGTSPLRTRVTRPDFRNFRG